MREAALSTVAEVYEDAARLLVEMQRCIDSVTGPIPEDSPYRYLRMSVGEAVVNFLTRAEKPKRIPDLVDELKAGHCILGVIKSPSEIVTKSVKAFVKIGRLVWMDKGNTLVGLPAWKRRK